MNMTALINNYFINELCPRGWSHNGRNCPVRSVQWVLREKLKTHEVLALATDNRVQYWVVQWAKGNEGARRPAPVTVPGLVPKSARTPREKLKTREVPTSITSPLTTRHQDWCPHRICLQQTHPPQRILFWRLRQQARPAPTGIRNNG